MNNTVAYVDELCPRCGSKRKISRTWEESIPTFSGNTTVEFSQIVCTNEECQAAFEENLKKETDRREVLRVQKEKNDADRKASSIQSRMAPKKNKSRI